MDIKRNKLLDQTLEDFEKELKATGRYSKVRAYARLLLTEAGVKKECKECGFSHHVEACHIKGISSFEKTSKISEINNLKNLVYLCPNHHWMLDNGLITLTNVSVA